jgi:hypothetical protein
MTTIVYDHKNRQIAIDSQSTSAGIAINMDAKKWHYRGADLFFICGKNSDIDMLIDYAVGNASAHKDFLPDASAILVSNGLVYLCEVNNNGVCDKTKLEHSMCIGSGDRLGLAALDFGKSAKEAVEYAATRDIYTGGRVHVFNLDSMRFED